MKITLVYDESDISLITAARVVTKYMLNPKLRAIVVDNETYFVKNTKGISTYTISAADRIAQYIGRE